jgi:hypothetical protein
MKLTTRFAILAGILGLLYGIIDAVFCMAATMVLCWRFGWGFDVLVPVLGAAFGITFGAAIFFGYRFGEYAQGLSADRRTQAIKVFYIIFWVGVAAFVMIALSRWQYISNQKKAVEQADIKNQNMQQMGERLKTEKIKISALSIKERPDRLGFDILIDADSVRAGKYELSAAINQYGLDCQCFKGEVLMVVGKNSQTIFVAYAKLIDAASRQLSGRSVTGEGFMADYPCEVTFAQVLNQKESEAVISYLQYHRQEFVATSRIDIPLHFSTSGGKITACHLYEKQG